LTEAEDRLNELNNTIDLSLRRKRLDWFRKKKIKVFTMYCKTYITPDVIPVSEIVLHVNLLNKYSSEIHELLRLCDETGIEVKREGRIYISSKPASVVDEMNVVLQMLIETIQWFTKNSLEVTVVKMDGGVQYYQYKGVKEKS
jgi:hypothetical protein